VTSEKLAGNGVALVRERAMAERVQEALERVYLLDRVADVGDYVDGTSEGTREALIVRAADDGAIEMSLRLPQIESDTHLDAFCQIIEGVSHFVYVVDRASAGRGTTQLEMELQAEVDKWVVLAASMRPFDVDQSARLRQRLYERVTFAHEATTELGERYRIANDAAHRFVRRLEREYVGPARFHEMRAALRRFYRVGQEEKLRLGRAA
jgi:hypothetical protein